LLIPEDLALADQVEQLREEIERLQAHAHMTATPGRQAEPWSGNR
jgi:hypothetical protein